MVSNSKYLNRSIIKKSSAWVAFRKRSLIKSIQHWHDHKKLAATRHSRSITLPKYILSEENTHLSHCWRCLLLPGSERYTVTDYYTSPGSLYNMPTHSWFIIVYHNDMHQQVNRTQVNCRGSLWGWRPCTTSDCKLTRGGSLPCEWEKKRRLGIFNSW